LFSKTSINFENKIILQLVFVLTCEIKPVVTTLSPNAAALENKKKNIFFF